MENNNQNKKGYLHRLVSAFCSFEISLASLSGFLTISAVVWAVVNAIARYGFNSPIKGTYGFIGILMVPIIFLPWSYVLQTKGYMKIPLLLEKIPGRTYYLVIAIIDIISLFAFALFASALVRYSIDVWKLDIVQQDAYDLTSWPFHAAAALGMILMVIRLAGEVWGDLRHIKNPPPERPVTFIGG